MADELTLESGSPVVSARARKVVYQKSLSEVVKDLESHGMEKSVDSERKLKRWIAKGREADDLPPFDDVTQLAGWWRRMMACGKMTWKVPDFLLTAESSAKVESVAALDSEVIHSSALPDPEPMVAVTAADGDEPAQQALTQLNAFAAQWIAEMESAKRLKDDKRFWLAYERHEKVSEKIRKWQATALAFKKAAGDYVEERKVEEILSQVMSVTAMNFTNVLFALGRRLAPDQSDSELREIVLPLRDRCFAHLKATKFAHLTPS